MCMLNRLFLFVCVFVCLFQMLYSQAGQLEYDEVVDFTRARSSHGAAAAAFFCTLAIWHILDWLHMLQSHYIHTHIGDR